MSSNFLNQGPFASSVPSYRRRFIGASRTNPQASTFRVDPTKDGDLFSGLNAKPVVGSGAPAPAPAPVVAPKPVQKPAAAPAPPGDIFSAIAPAPAPAPTALRPATNIQPGSQSSVDAARARATGTGGTTFSNTNRQQIVPATTPTTATGTQADPLAQNRTLTGDPVVPPMSTAAGRSGTSVATGTVTPTVFDSISVKPVTTAVTPTIRTIATTPTTVQTGPTPLTPTIATDPVVDPVRTQTGNQNYGDVRSQAALFKSQKNQLIAAGYDPNGPEMAEFLKVPATARASALAGYLRLKNGGSVQGSVGTGSVFDSIAETGKTASTAQVAANTATVAQNNENRGGGTAVVTPAVVPPVGNGTPGHSGAYTGVDNAIEDVTVDPIIDRLLNTADNIGNGRAETLSDSDLYKAAETAVTRLMSGTLTPEQEKQYLDAFETLRATQAARDSKIKEGLVQAGLGDSGRYVEEGIVSTANQNALEDNAFNRQMAADKAKIIADQTVQGLGAANSLLGTYGSDLQSQRSTVVGALEAGGGLANDSANRVVTQQENEKDRELKRYLQNDQQTHEEKITRLNGEIAAAVEAGDHDQEVKLLGIKNGYELGVMREKYGYDAALTTLDGNIKVALQNGDFENAWSLQAQKYTLEAVENAADRAVEYAKIELNKYGIDVAALDKMVATFSEQEAAGTLAAGSTVSAIKNYLGLMGIDSSQISAPSDEQIISGVQSQIDQQETIFRLANIDTPSAWVGGDPMLDAKGVPQGQLTPAAMGFLNENINNLLFGEEMSFSETDGVGIKANGTVDWTAVNQRIGTENPLSKAAIDAIVSVGNLPATAATTATTYNNAHSDNDKHGEYYLKLGDIELKNSGWYKINGRPIYVTVKKNERDTSDGWIYQPTFWNPATGKTTIADGRDAVDLNMV